MTPSESERNPVEALAEEFFDRRRRGEKLTIDEYAARHPNLADEIRDVFPALMMIEDLGDTRAPSTVGAVAGDLQIERIGDFRILREVGLGGMGVVYEAEQESLGRRVALKVLPQQMLPNSTQRKRFQREAKSAARLHHTNIVPVFAVGESDGMSYYAMQFISGVALDQVLIELKNLASDKIPCGSITKPAIEVAEALASGDVALDSARADHSSAAPNAVAVNPSEADGASHSDSLRTAFSGSSTHWTNGTSDSRRRSDYWKSVAKIGIQVADALDYAHTQGIVHRDIKPGNLLLDTKGRVWVTDFGLAKAEDDQNLTRSGDVIGTLRYMAPETLSGSTDERTDICSLGLTLFELLALRPAFDADRRERLVEQIRHESPPALRRINPRVPADLDTIVAKATDHDPRHRYQLASELSRDLQRFIDNQPILARRLSVPARTVRWCRRNPALASLFAVLLMFSLTVSYAAIKLLSLADEREQALFRAEHEQIRANDERRRAESAEKKTLARLFDARLAQSKASRLNHRIGQRFGSLAAIREAAALVPQVNVSEDRIVQLKSEAFAALSHVDLQVHHRWQIPRSDYVLAIDRRAEQIAWGGGKEPLTIWSTAEEKNSSRISEPGRGIGVRRFSPDGRHLAALTTHHDGIQCTLWNVVTGARVLDTPAAGYFENFLFTDDGQFLVVANTADESVRFYEVATGQMVRSIDGGDSMRAIAVHPDGQLLAIASARQPVITVMDVETQQSVWRIETPSRSVSLTWSPNGKLLAAASANFDLVTWNFEQRQQQALLRGHQNAGILMWFSGDSNLLATCAWDGTTRLWDPLSGRELVVANMRCAGFTESHELVFHDGGRVVGTWEVGTSDSYRHIQIFDDAVPEYVNDSVAIHRQNQIVVTGSRDGLRFHNSASGQLLAHMDVGAVRSIVFHEPTGDLLSSGEFGVWRWPVTCDDKQASLQIGPPRQVYETAGEWPGPFPRLAISRDATALVISDRHRCVMLDLNGTRPPVELPQPGFPCIAVSSDGRWIATGLQGAKIWAAETGRLVREIGFHEPTALAFSGDGQWLGMSNDAAYQIVDTQTWEVVYGNRRATEDSANGSIIRFSPDGRLVAITDTRRVVTLVDLHRKSTVASFESPHTTARIVDLSFSSDGDVLVVATAFATELWNLSHIGAALDSLGIADLALPRSDRSQREDWIRSIGLNGGGLDARPLIRRAVESIHRGEWNAAHEVVHELMRKVPENGHVWYLHGRIQVTRHRQLEAIDDFARAIKLDPSHIDAGMWLGMLSWQHDRFADAARAWQQVLEQQPGHVNARRQLARLYAVAPAPFRDPQRALELIERVSMDSDSGLNDQVLAAARYRLGDFAESREVALRALGGTGPTAQPLERLWLSMNQYRLGEWDAARNTYRQAIAEHRMRPQLAQFAVREFHRLRQEVADLLELEDETAVQVAAGHYDAETLLVSASVASGRLWLARNTAKDPRPGEDQMWWHAAREGDALRLQLEIPAGGSYAVSAATGRAPTSGKCQFYFEQRPLGPPIDGYSPRVEKPTELLLGNITTTAGEHELLLRMEGRDQRSQGWRFALESIRVIPVANAAVARETGDASD